MALFLYHRAFDDERIDYDLITTIINHIHGQYSFGAILVFLPGYGDIVSLRDLLRNQSNSRDKFLILCLHSQMSSIDQSKVFRPSPRGLRKVILATNIAETSITIDDVVFVIDSGKEKEVINGSVECTI